MSEVVGGARLITLLGPPGIGKTSLAAAAAERLADVVEGGVWFCDLSNASTEEALCLSVGSLFEDPGASSLGLQSPTSAANATAERVGSILDTRGPMVLVLDNFEHLCGSAHVVHRWLRTSRGLVAIVTSRERLAIDGEHVVELAPLSVPPLGAKRDDALASDAVRLFLTRAREAGAPPTDDVDAVVEIVRQLDGIPLAIELAAARTRLLGPRELSQRLGRGEDVLASTGMRSSRHRTLTAAIAWSWALLGPDEQLALAVCSVFRKSFSVEAAEALIGGELARRGRTGAPAPVELVGALRDKSLVHLDESGRLSLYQSIAEFAAKRLEEPGVAGVTEVRLGHARHFAELAERFIKARLLQEVDPDTAVVARARLERDNLVAAFDHVSTLPRERVERALRVTLAIALALLYAIPADAADRNLVSVLQDAELTDPRARAMVLLARQTSLSALGRYDEALAVAHEVIDLPDVDVGLTCFALVYAGIQLRSEGDVHRALTYHQRAKEILEGRPHTRLFGMNIACMGRLQCDMSNLEAARELNGLATKICDDIGDLWLSALGIANLAQLEQEMQSFARADELFAQALARFSAAHEPQYEGIYACRRGGLYLEWDRLDLARDWLRTGQRTLARLNMPLQNVILHASWALLEAEAGQLAAARAELDLARRFAERGASGVVGLVLELLSAAVELHDAPIHPATVERWRERYASLRQSDDADARAARTNLDTRFALRMLARALGKHDPPTAGCLLRIGKDAMCFSIDDGKTVDLARRGSLRRMLAALVEARVSSPGSTLDGAALTSAGWPDERILVEAAATRVRVAIATLRKLGLRNVLLTRDDGYLLDPAVRVERGG